MKIGIWAENQVAPPFVISHENRYLGWKQSGPHRLCFLMKIDIWAENKVSPFRIFSWKSVFGLKTKCPPFRIFSWKSVFGLKTKWTPPFVFSHENRYLGWKQSGTAVWIFLWKSIFFLKTYYILFLYDIVCLNYKFII